MLILPGVIVLAAGTGLLSRISGFRKIEIHELILEFRSYSAVRAVLPFTLLQMR